MSSRWEIIKKIIKVAFALDYGFLILKVENPAPFELRISQMQLLTEDVEFETEPVSFLLPPSTENQPSSTTIILSGNFLCGIIAS